jgi:hypothetical protein
MATTKQLAAGGGAVLLALALTQSSESGDSGGGRSAGASDDSVATAIGSWDPFGSNDELGEISVDGAGSVIYDDPEGSRVDDDTTEDDANESFEDAADALGEERGTNVESTTLAENYGPDTTEDGQAPTSGVAADPGTSQSWGRAPEDENDDLNERTASSNLSGEEKAMFDRLSNIDDQSKLWENDNSSGESSGGGSSRPSGSEITDSWGDRIEVS